MQNIFTPGEFEARYKKRLAIIVPYRNRAEHLSQFIPHIISYFERDKLDRHINYSIHIIEQEGEEPFNRGKLCNCGYMLARDAADYFCFHDVDYLPMWADYSWSESPARLIWHGLALREDRNTFFGGVVLFDKRVFEGVNGFPNVYWGWGREDRELAMRCKAAGMEFERRDGTYLALPHKHAGFVAPGVYSEAAQRTHSVFATRQGNIGELMRIEGLPTLKFEPLATKRITMRGTPVPNAFHHVVDIGSSPP